MQVMQGTCTVEECTAPVVARGLCRKHYMRQRRKGDVSDGRKNARPECSVDGCSSPHAAKGLCQNHYQQQRHKVEHQARRESTPRLCAHCGAVCRRRLRGPLSYCSAECKTKAAVADGRAARASLKNYYKSRYGLPVEDVAVMRSGGCQICGRSGGVGRWGQLHVDHCHDSGRVRGVLCSECNTGLGKFGDDPAVLRRAADYLESAVDRFDPVGTLHIPTEIRYDHLEKGFLRGRHQDF